MTLSTNKLLRSPLIAIAFVVALTGCTQRFADLTIVSTRNIDLSNATLDARSGRRVKGEDCKPIILFFPTGTPNMETAVDRALEKGQGNVMVDQVSYARNWWAILYGENCIEVEGSVIQTDES